MRLNELISSFVVKDGGKRKPSKFALMISAAIAVILVVGIQFLSTVQNQPKGITAVETPKIELSAGLHPPEVTSAADVEQATAKRVVAEKMKSMTFQPLKSVTLQLKVDVPVGSEVWATLSSGGSNGTVTALLDSSVEADGDVILPKGTLLYGKGSSSDERLYVLFTTAVFPDRRKQKIKASAFDQSDRMEGLKGKKISDYAFKLATSAGLIFLGGVADGMRANNYNSPFVQQRTSVGDAALNGVSTATMEMGRNTLQKMNEEKSRIEVKATTKIIVIFGDMSETQ